ncbi:MAG: DUF4595 domain-containing protein [Muribaculaceae bacterium]|nr:DUF4595 domain-containing protein [Muribaculaceae bacterium]
MKTFFKFLTAVLVMATFGLTACSNNDDEPKDSQSADPTTENVFSQGLPAEADGYSFNTNDKGQLTSIISDGSVIATFEYGEFTRAATYDVRMKTINYYGNNDIYIQTNAQGYATHAIKISTDEDNDTETWDFEYNSDGQLISMNSSDEGEFRITYTDGNITKVVETGYGYRSEYVFNYTDQENPKVIPNKGNIMFFDEIYYVDMDVIEIAYFGGLLGKSTKNLPVGGVDADDPDDARSFKWNLNTAGLPDELKIVESWDGNEYIETYKFSWK